MRLAKSSGKPKRLKAPFILRKIVGHSMLPVLPPGTVVIGLRYFRTLKPGYVVVIVHEGKEKIKRIGEIKDDKVFVVGDHPDASTDSRQFGWLNQEVIKAVIVWPRAKPTQSLF